MARTAIHVLLLLLSITTFALDVLYLARYVRPNTATDWLVLALNATVMTLILVEIGRLLLI